MIYALLGWLSAGAGIIYWGGQLFYVWETLKRVPILHKVTPRDPEQWPKVSIIVPARNEEKTIEEAVKTRLSEDYPQQEIILVDDRSTDLTGKIIDNLAGIDSRIRVIHIQEIPPGWLGKIYAMQKGCELATGDWLLFSDADVHFQGGTLRKAVAYAQDKGLDHLAVFPEMWSRDPLLGVLHSFFIRFIIIGFRAWDVEKKNSKASAGVGAFNLVRRAAFTRTPGFEWLKLELADDLALGQMLKDSGAKCSLVNGRNLLGLYYYNNVWDMAKGTERAGFTAIGQFSLARIAAVFGLLLFFEFTPFILLFSPVLWMYYLGVLLLIISVVISIAINKWANRPVWTVFFWPIAVILVTIAAARMGILGKLRGGVYWRGTFYSTELLKPGRRCRFG